MYDLEGIWFSSLNFLSASPKWLTGHHKVFEHSCLQEVELSFPFSWVWAERSYFILMNGIKQGQGEIHRVGHKRTLWLPSRSHCHLGHLLWRKIDTKVWADLLRKPRGEELRHPTPAKKVNLEVCLPLPFKPQLTPWLQPCERPWIRNTKLCCFPVSDL